MAILDLIFGSKCVDCGNRAPSLSNSGRCHACSLKIERERQRLEREQQEREERYRATQAREEEEKRRRGAELKEQLRRNNASTANKREESELAKFSANEAAIALSFVAATADGEFDLDRISQVIGISLQRHWSSSIDDSFTIVRKCHEMVCGGAADGVITLMASISQGLPATMRVPAFQAAVEIALIDGPINDAEQATLDISQGMLKIPDSEAQSIIEQTQRNRGNSSDVVNKVKQWLIEQTQGNRGRKKTRSFGLTIDAALASADDDPEITQTSYGTQIEMTIGGERVEIRQFSDSREFKLWVNGEEEEEGREDVELRLRELVCLKRERYEDDD